LKKKPPPEEVRKVMTNIQRTILHNNIDMVHIGNEDETNVVSCAELLHQFVTASAVRAVDPGTH
jgi:cytidylate kinase